MSTPDETGTEGYTEQGERAEQSAFRGEGEYSGGGFAGGTDELARTETSESDEQAPTDD